MPSFSKKGMLEGAELYVFKNANEIYALARCPLNTLGKSQEGSLRIGDSLLQRASSHLWFTALRVLA
jgi:hypothetical protein